MYYISLGYPIGLKTIGFVVELENVQKEIPAKEALLWAEKFGVTSIEEDSETLRTCIHYGIFACAPTYDELYKKISTNRLVRQGCGSAVDDRYVLCLAESVFYPTERQNDIWKLANSRKSIREVWTMLKSKYSNELTVEHFFYDIKILMDNNLMFVV